MLLGLLADTHGFLGDDVREALSGCERILHAGDVGPGVLAGLADAGPVVAVRGNNDTTGEAANLPDVALVIAGGVRIAVVHRREDAPRWPYDVLVCGHSHRASVDCVDGRLLLNPGAAGRRGFHTRRSVGLLRVGGSGTACEIVDLGPRKARP